MITKLTLEYDGAAFAGWARQPDKRTVQEELERALRHGARRQRARRPAADADRRRAHRRGRARMGAGRQLRARGGRSAAPERAAGRRPRGARRRARAGGLRRAPRRLQSHLLLPRARAAHAQRVRARARVLVDRRRSTATRSTRARARCVGRHDFTAFTPTETEHSYFTCDVMRAEWRGDGELLEFWIEADMFLRHMNRVLVGTMLDVATGLRTLRGVRGAARGQAARAGRAHRARARAGAGERHLRRPADLHALRDRSGPYAGLSMLNVLLTNDDGIEADGLQAMRRALLELDGVRLAVIAPDGNRSAMARSITTRRPLWVEEVPFADGDDRLRHRRHARRLRAPGEPRADRGLRGRPGRLGHQPRRQPRR